MRWKSLRRASSKPWGFVVSCYHHADFCHIIIMAMYFAVFIILCNELLWPTDYFDILQICQVHIWHLFALRTALQKEKVLKRYKRKQLDGWDIHVEDEIKFQISNTKYTNTPSQISNTHIKNMKYTILKSRWMVGTDMRTKASRSGPS